jgi:hypothetical protein
MKADESETVSDPSRKKGKGKKKDTRAAVAEESKIPVWRLRKARIHATGCEVEP